MRKLAFALLFAATAAQAAPETVMVTYRAQKGSEAQLAQVLAKHWATAQRLGLVTSDARELFRTGSTFIEIFTWKDAEIPDNAPPEIRTLWAEMSKLVEKNGISIVEVERVRE